jgi:hypothetical protein
LGTRKEPEDENHRRRAIGNAPGPHARHYGRSCRGWRHAGPAKRAITLRDLLTFRSGHGMIMVFPDRYPVQKAICTSAYQAIDD